jgi:methylated-DNA-[protein]-cysteine S-methyltransferase
MSGRDLHRLVSAAEASERTGTASDRLREAALDEGLVDVALGMLDGPVGEIQVAVTPRGLVYIAYDDEDRDTLVTRYVRELSPRVLRSARATDAVRRELAEYFAGARTAFDLRLDRRLMHPFAKKVLAATSRVAYGHLATYGEIARRIGHPSAARAVGAALGSNPIPIVVPCHRVVGAGGKLTGYAGGLERKEVLLRLEGALPPVLLT